MQPVQVGQEIVIVERKNAGECIRVRLVALKFERQALDGLAVEGNRRRRRPPSEAGDAGIEFGGGLGRAVDSDRHMVAEHEERVDRIAFDLDQDDAAAHRNRTGRRIEGDVFLLADLAADIAKHAGRDGRRQIAGLLLRIVNEFVDDDFRVARHRQRRLIGEQQLRLADGRGLDPLVADYIMTDQQLAQWFIRRLAGRVRVDRRSDTNLFRLAEGRRIEARQTEGSKQYSTRRIGQFLPCLALGQ